MTKVKNFAGFDVSKKFFDVCLSEQEDLGKQFIYDDQGLVALIKWLPKDCHCVMEATGPYYLKLAYYLHQNGFVVSVVNPLVIKRFSQMRLLRAKTDKCDARMIAAYGVTEQPTQWEPPAGYIIKLQQLEAALQLMQKQRTALLCQTEAFTAGGLMDKEMKCFLQKNIAHFNKQIICLETRMQSIIEEHHQQMLNNLTSIPGVGKKSAIALIVLSSGFTKFSNYKQLSAYVGLSPRIYQSGSSVRSKGRICKMGMSRIRAMLYVCAWSAKRCNKACAEIYERLVAKGKSGRLALIAVANKIIKQVFAIATNNRSYDREYVKKICF